MPLVKLSKSILEIYRSEIAKNKLTIPSGRAVKPFAVYWVWSGLETLEDANKKNNLKLALNTSTSVSANLKVVLKDGDVDEGYKKAAKKAQSALKNFDAALDRNTAAFERMEQESKKQEKELLKLYKAMKSTEKAFNDAMDAMINHGQEWLKSCDDVKKLLNADLNKIEISHSTNWEKQQKNALRLIFKLKDKIEIVRGNKLIKGWGVLKIRGAKKDSAYNSYYSLAKKASLDVHNGKVVSFQWPAD